MINDFLTALFIVCVVLTALVIVLTVIDVRKERNVKICDCSNSDNGTNGED